MDILFYIANMLISIRLLLYEKQILITNCNYCDIDVIFAATFFFTLSELHNARDIRAYTFVWKTYANMFQLHARHH